MYTSDFFKNLDLGNKRSVEFELRQMYYQSLHPYIEDRKNLRKDDYIYLVSLREAYLQFAINISNLEDVCNHNTLREKLEDNFSMAFKELHETYVEKLEAKKNNDKLRKELLGRF